MGGALYRVRDPPNTEAVDEALAQRVDAAVEAANDTARAGWATAVEQALTTAEQTSSNVLSNAIYMSCGQDLCTDQASQQLVAAYNAHCRQHDNDEEACRSDPTCRYQNSVCTNTCSNRSRDECEQLKRQNLCAVQTSGTSLVNGQLSSEYRGCLPVGGTSVRASQLCFGPCKNGSGSRDCVTFADSDEKNECPRGLVPYDASCGCAEFDANDTCVACDSSCTLWPDGRCRPANRHTCELWWQRNHPILEGDDAEAVAQRAAAAELVDMVDACSQLDIAACVASSDCTFDGARCRESLAQTTRRAQLQRQVAEPVAREATAACADPARVCVTPVADALAKFQVRCVDRWGLQCLGAHGAQCRTHDEPDECGADPRCRWLDQDNVCDDKHGAYCRDLDVCRHTDCVEVRTLNSCPPGFHTAPPATSEPMLLSQAVCDRYKSTCPRMGTYQADLAYYSDMSSAGQSLDGQRQTPASCVIKNVAQKNVAEMRRAAQNHSLQAVDLAAVRAALNSVGSAALQGVDLDRQKEIEPSVAAVANASQMVRSRIASQCGAETALFNFVYKSCHNMVGVPCSIDGVSQSNEARDKSAACLQSVAVDSEAIRTIQQDIRVRKTRPQPGPFGVANFDEIFRLACVVIAAGLVACSAALALRGGSASASSAGRLLGTARAGLRNGCVSVIVFGVVVAVVGGLVEATAPASRSYVSYSGTCDDEERPPLRTGTGSLAFARAACDADKRCARVVFHRTPDSVRACRRQPCPRECVTSDPSGPGCDGCCPSDCRLIIDQVVTAGVDPTTMAPRPFMQQNCANVGESDCTGECVWAEGACTARPVQQCPSGSVLGVDGKCRGPGEESHGWCMECSSDAPGRFELHGDDASARSCEESLRSRVPRLTTTELLCPQRIPEITLLRKNGVPWDEVGRSIWTNGLIVSALGVGGLIALLVVSRLLR